MGAASLVTAVLAAALWSPAASPVRISGVHFDGYLPGNPEPDSAIRLTNTDDKKPADISGYVLTERFSPTSRKGKSVGVGLINTNVDRGTAIVGGGRGEGSSTDAPGDLRFPQGTVIPPGKDIWVAATAWGFRKVWGRNPHFEASPTDPTVADLDGPGTFLKLPGSRGTVALVDDAGGIIDFVPYETTKEPLWTEEDFGGLPWNGGPIRLFSTSSYGWTGQVLARDRDERGRLLPDTRSAADWDSGFSQKQLGVDPTHRIEKAGQTRFTATPLVNVRARVLATSAPDNNHKALVDAILSARESVRVRIYEFTNPKIGEALLKARSKGVKVTIYLEGSPVGGIPDQERWILDRAARAGCEVFFLGGTKGNPIKPRYRFDHSKYVIIDNKKAIIGSENYGRTGVPLINSYGNRGWMVHVEHPVFVRQLLAVWDADLRPGVNADIVGINDSLEDAYGLPYRSPDFTPDETIQRGRYDSPEPALLVEDTMTLELVLSPDTSLNENTAIIGMMNRAKRSLIVQQNSIRRRWGKKHDDPETEGDVPNLPLQAVVAAARRGVAVRVLLDSTWYNVRGDEDRDNDDVAQYLNELAREEGLDIVAKVINLEATALQKIHTKGIIVDEREVFVGSINWTENSFKGNREVGVVITHPRVAGYYANLFRRDWARSRIYEATTTDNATVHMQADEKSKVVLRLARGDKLWVVGEHRRRNAAGAAETWLEVRLPTKKGARDAAAFIHGRFAAEPVASAGEALHVIGRRATVEGVIVATNVSDKRIQFRFADEKRPPFTAIIFTSNLDKFKAAGIEPATAYQGKRVRVNGFIKVYRAPEIILNDPTQIEIVR